MYSVCLYLHIMGAIAAFGPSFTFPVISGLIKREPQYRNFALRAIHAIHFRLMFPVTLTLLVSGGGLIYFAHVDLTEPWLLTSLALFFLALGVGLFVQGPAMHRLIELSAAPLSDGPGAATAIPAEVKQELRGLSRRTRIGRYILTISLFSIAALMIWRPGGV